MIRTAKTIIELFPHKLTFTSLRSTAGQVQIEQFQEVQLETGYYHQGRAAYEQSIQLIRNLLAELNISRKNVSVNLILDEVITRVIEVPTLSAKDLQKLIANNTAEYLTVSPDDYLVKHQVMSTSMKDGVSKDRVLLAAIPKLLLQELRNFFNDCKLDVGTIELFASSLSRLYQGAVDQTLGILVLDDRQSHFVILEQGQLFMHTTFSLVPSVYSPFLVSSTEAAPRSESLGLDEVIANVSSYLNFFSASRYGASIDHLVVLGSGDVESVSALLRDRFGLPISTDLPENVLHVSSKNGIDFIATRHPALLGMAMRTNQKRQLHIVLRPEQEAADDGAFAKRLLPICGFVVLAAAVWVFYPAVLAHKSRLQLAGLQSQTAAYAAIDQQTKDLAVYQSVYQQDLQFLTYINQQDVPVELYLSTIQQLLPQNVTMSAVTMKKGDILLTLNLQSPLQAAQLIESFNRSGYFEQITSANVPLSQSPFSYSIDLKVIKPISASKSN